MGHPPAYDNGAAPTTPSREYIVAGGHRIAKIEAGSTLYYHRDHLSTRVTTDANGNVVSQQGHYPFGESWYQTGNTTTDQQFTSYARDSESGNDYALAREFVNRLGRFSSPDPLSGNTANPQSLNRYAYALNDPIDLLDPEGEYVECDPGTGNCFDIGGDWENGFTTCTVDGMEMSCGDANALSQMGASVQCPNNSCTTYSITTVNLNGQAVATYGQIWQYWAFETGEQYYADSGPGAMYYTPNAAGIAAGAYFFGMSQAADLEFGGSVSQDANGFYTYDLSTLGECVPAGCTDTIPNTGAPDVWHTHPQNSDNNKFGIIEFMQDRSAPMATPPDYVTNTYGTFLIGAWSGGGIHGTPDVQKGAEALDGNQIASICQLTGATPFSTVSPCK